MKITYAEILISVKNCEDGCPHYSDGGGYGEPWCKIVRSEMNGRGIHSNCPYKKEMIIDDEIKSNKKMGKCKC